MEITKNNENWIKISEVPLIPEVSDSPKAVTEFQDIPGEIRMFRGTTTLKHNISLLADAICDPKARMKWVERMSENILIKGRPDQGEWFSYEAYDLIWPVSNRDYVFRQTMEKSLHNGSNRTVVNVMSIELPDYPVQPKRVRGTLPTCIFTLDEISDNITDIEVIVQVDPGGSLPGFVKNLIQKGWSLKTMQAINTYMTNH